MVISLIITGGLDYAKGVEENPEYMVDLDTKVKDYDDFNNYDDYYDVSEEVSGDTFTNEFVDVESEVAKSGSTSYRDVVAVMWHALVLQLVLFCCKALS